MKQNISMFLTSVEGLSTSKRGKSEGQCNNISWADLYIIGHASTNTAKTASTGSKPINEHDRESSQSESLISVTIFQRNKRR